MQKNGWKPETILITLLFSLLLKKKTDNIIIHFCTNDAPYKNEDAIYNKLRSIKDFINKGNPSCKEIYISTNITVKQQKCK